MKRLALLLLAATSLTALAESGRLLDLKIEARDGADYREYRYQGRTWVAGEQGEPYQLTLRNRSADRLLVVLSVDGVNVVNGKTADFNQGGYVLGPWQTTIVKGWRKSLGSVAQFYFTDLPDSYAARTDRPDDVGVIGAAVFRERQRVEVAPPMAKREMRRESQDAAPRSEAAGKAAAAPAPESSLGTGHGEIERSQASTTTFERDSSSPYEVLAIRYDTRRNLVAAGVIAGRHKQPGPSPFPGEDFVPDPPLWR